MQNSTTLSPEMPTLNPTIGMLFGLHAPLPRSSKAPVRAHLGLSAHDDREVVADERPSRRRDQILALITETSLSAQEVADKLEIHKKSANEHLRNLVLLGYATRSKGYDSSGNCRFLYRHIPSAVLDKQVA